MLNFWRWVFYSVLKGGYKNHEQRLGRRYFTLEEAYEAWPHANTWYANFIARRINP